MRLLLVCSVLLLLRCAFSDEQPETIQLEQQVSGSLGLNEHKRYELTIPANLTQDLNLFVVAEGVTNDPMDLPNVIIEKGDRSWLCFKKERADLCLVNSTQVKANDVFTLKVSCTYECKYFVRAYLSLQYMMDLGRSLSLTFTEKTGFLMQLNLPNSLNFSEVGLTVLIENPADAAEGVYMFVNAGMNVSVPTADVFQFKGKPIWSDGVGIFLRNGI